VKSKLLSTLIFAALFLSACAPAASSSPSPTEVEETIETEASAEVQADAGECIACHTDKERLIETAAPVKEAEAESSGVG
jgi:PBP1b-binding outer membrane lipoprotein LpoB